MLTNMSIRRIAYHAIGWLLFIMHEVVVLIYWGSSASWWEFVCFYPLEICLFYCNSHYVFPKSLARGKGIFILILMMIIQLLVYSILTFDLDILVSSIKANKLVVDIRNADLFRASWRYLFICGFSTAYWLTIRHIVRLKREAILREAYQHARLNAHLLFNTLNFIYNSVENISAKASEAIMLLSDIMRYALSEITEQGTIELREEIKQVENYVKLHQIRYNNKLYINASISPLAFESALPIPPLLLMTFLENIFKHGNLGIRKHPALITISCEEKYLHVRTENIKRQGTIVPFSHHMGLANARTRLDNNYGKNYDLVLEDNERIFILDLKVWL